MDRNPLALLRILATAAVLALAQPAAAVDWQPFPGEPMDTSALLKGAITDLYGNLLARTPNFTLSADEAEGIANVILGKVPRPSAIPVEGNRYTITGSEPKGLYARAGNIAMVVTMTDETVVFGVYDASIPGARAMQSVKDIASVLRSLGH